ncbi:MAG: hypothetical protein H0W50_11390 [Parachlamydiaceae bacterium]|nr:hypothetical protein [Parachlamydiaceae bacterium]
MQTSIFNNIPLIPLIGEAQKVLGLNDSKATASDQSVWQGKHWSYYVLAGGCLIGAIIAVAGLILQNGFQVLSGCILLITNGIGAYYNKKFSNLTTLGTLVNLLTLKVKETAKELGALKQINNEFTAANDTLKKKISEVKKIFDKGKSKLDDKIKELQKVEESLKETERKMEVLNLLYEKLKKSTHLFSVEMQELIDRSLHFKETGEQFKGEVDRFDGENEELKIMIKNFDGENSEFAEENNQLAIFNDSFTTQLQQMKKMSEDDRRVQMDLQKEIEQLNRSSAEISSMNHKIEKAQAKAEK